MDIEPKSQKAPGVRRPRVRPTLRLSSLVLGFQSLQGYPYNLDFDYGALSQLQHLSIDNLGDPFIESNYGFHSRQFEVGVLDWCGSWRRTNTGATSRTAALKETCMAFSSGGKFSRMVSCMLPEIHITLSSRLLKCIKWRL